MNGLWIPTVTGRQVDPADPDPSEINLIDIAHGLSHLCRYVGQTRVFYSVAEHSVRVSHLASVLSCESGWGLLHDGHEAYIGDMTKPVKMQQVGWEILEMRGQLAVSVAMGLWTTEPCKKVKEADRLTALLEREELLRFDSCPNINGRWGDKRDLVVRVNAEIGPMGWDPVMARFRFLQRATELGLLANPEDPDVQQLVRASLTGHPEVHRCGPRSRSRRSCGGSRAAKK